MTRPRDFSEVVRENWERTTAFLLAGSEPCVEIRDDELEAIQGNRVLVGRSFEDLEAWDPSGSWILAVILCPDDSTQRLADWALERGIDAHRVHFYLHPRTSWDALEPWNEAGFPTERVDDDVDSWQRLHRLFGLALSERIYQDWAETETGRGTRPDPK